MLGTRTHSSTTGDTPLDMTVTRSGRHPPSYSQSLANSRNVPARPSVITCAPPASSSWGDRTSDVKGSSKDENGRQGHRRELLSGESILYSSSANMICKIWEDRVTGVSCSLVSLYCTAVRQTWFVRFEVFMAVTMKNGVFKDGMPCGSCKNRRFGGT
jgi:hypothetical protein